MPQMSPLNWILLPFSFMMILMLFNPIIFFSMNPPIVQYLKMGTSLEEWKW